MDYTSFAPGRSANNQNLTPPVLPPVPSQKSFTPKFIALVVLLLLIGAGAYAGVWYWQNQQLAQEAVPTFTPRPSASASPTPDTSTWKTYTNTKYGFEFKYPEKLTPSISGEIVNLSHSIPFENTNGGCDMKGDSVVSKTLADFGLSIKIVPGTIKPPYVDGTYSAGALNGEWIYMGAEGCGQTNYYFPISGNRTLVVTKAELQILSDVATPEVRNRVLAVPGVISSQESKTILNQILSTFKFTNSADNSDWKIYDNWDYSFELAFTDSWKGYRMFSYEGSQGVGHPFYFEFSMPTSDKRQCVLSVTDEVCGYASIFTITQYSREVWDQMPTNQKIGLKVLSEMNLNGETAYTDGVYTYSITALSTLPADLKNINFNIPQVISSWHRLRNGVYSN